MRVLSLRAQAHISVNTNMLSKKNTNLDQSYTVMLKAILNSAE